MKISLRQILQLIAPTEDISVKVGRDSAKKPLVAQHAAKYGNHMVTRIEAEGNGLITIEVEEHAPVGFVAGCALPPLP